ncbi:MFS transporter [Candidatus Pacearchaeota archaeon]|nr:MFS transporter [Candidatus Pacearchaeota archaeon]
MADEEKEVETNEEIKLSDEERKRNMSLGIKEGSASTVMSIITDTYMTPFALALGANSVHIGFLNSFSGLLSPLAQVYGSTLKYQRKLIILFTVAWQTLMLLPILFLGIFFVFGIRTGLPTILILFYSLYIVFGAISAPAWFSLIGDIVPEKDRGKYFGKRNSILAGIGIVVTLIGSFILDYFKTGGMVLAGFSILFLVAIFSRIISYVILKRISDIDGGSPVHEGFVYFFRNLHKTNYGRFVIYIALINFSAMIASPFFTVYMLEELNLSYVWFAIISLSQAVSMMAFMLVWGKFADRYGNKELLIIGSLLIPVLPLLWIFNQNQYYLLIPMFVGGIGWAAFNLSSSNFVYDSVGREKRATYLAYMNIFAGIGIFLGAALGGLMIKYLPIKFMNIFLFVFLVSAILRALTAVIMMPLIKEVRKVEKFSFVRRVMPLLHLRMLGHHTTLSHHTHHGATINKKE